MSNIQEKLKQEHERLKGLNDILQAFIQNPADQPVDTPNGEQLQSLRKWLHDKSPDLQLAAYLGTDQSEQGDALMVGARGIAGIKPEEVVEQDSVQQFGWYQEAESLPFLHLPISDFMAAQIIIDAENGNAAFRFKVANSWTQPSWLLHSNNTIADSNGMIRTA